jgi:hypothetical protein
MQIRTASAWALSLAFLASSAAAEPLPTAGLYHCIVTMVGDCAWIPAMGERFCMSYPVSRGGDRRARLQLDFERNLATLNGLRGTILRGGPGGNGPPIIVWRDRTRRGAPTLEFQPSPYRASVMLSQGDHYDHFSCRRSR